MALPGSGFKYLQVSVPAGATSVVVGKNTHGLPFKPVVYAIIPLRTSTSGEVNPNTAFWWDRTAPDTGDGGLAVTIACGTAPTGNPYRLGLLLGPSAPGTSAFEW